MCPLKAGRRRRSDVEWQGVHVQLVRHLVCSHCGRDWEADRGHPETCAYCGEIDEKVVDPTGV